MLCYAKYTSYYVVFQKETTSSTISWTRTVRLQNFLVHLLSSRSRQRGRLSAQELSICLSVCLFVCMSVAKVQKTRFSQKLSNLELWSLLTTYRQVVHGLFKEPIIGSLQSKMAEIRHLENRHDVIIFFCRGWSHLDKISQTGTEWHVDWGDVWKWKPDVEFQYGGRLGEFNGIGM